ncbi:golgi uridine diphosphate-N-acetylglucosamine transporter [Marasmius tenuissimus]|uniref:Golgi uridine diphosphate-N-acetylglucosamine transporter n=1 Tax=Marasmius tenuissimus TaxID=585030 RepID=A0ABR2ZNM3_9AGAR
MSVHIIFRSGGLVITMLLGWIVAKKKYNITQIISIVIVTVGVLLTTLSASKTSSPSSSQDGSITTYLIGIAILTAALVFAGCLGLVQDYTYTKYGRPAPQKQPSNQNNSGSSLAPPPTWQESMFYLHFLALPMFLTVRKDIISQFHAMRTGPVSTYSLRVSDLPSSLKDSLTSPPFTSLPIASDGQNASSPVSVVTVGDDAYAHLRMPSALVPLLLNTLTQSLCAAGVNKLTTRVSALTVTLILVVRKAVSLVLSVVVGLGNTGHNGDNVDMKMMWTGAALVMLGTIGYSLGTQRRNNTKPRQKKE